jgi:prepilin-type N-terminal cleavage/methylation domain-containing protein
MLRSRTAATYRHDQAGFTILEATVALVISGVLATVGMFGFQQYRERTALTRAGSVLQSDVALTRSLAIRDRQNVSLVADETLREYVVRDTSGTVLHERRLGNGTDLAISSLDVAASGDSLTFDSRGLLITAGTVQIDFTRGPHDRLLLLNAFGRGRVITP